MDMEKLFERLAAKMDANQAKAEADRQAHRREIKEIMEKIMNFNHNEAMACQEMEAHQEERKPTSPDRRPEAAQEDEVPAEDATVMPVRELKKKQRRDRKLAAEHCCQKLKSPTRENCRPQKRLAVARSGSSSLGKVTWHMKEIDRKMPRHATVARRMRDIFRQNTTRCATVA
jgi:hypothetical protein